MNEPIPPIEPDPDIDTLLIEVPDPSASQIIGTVMRPPRMMTLGRRRSDRWVATVMVLAVLAFIASVVWISWRQEQLVGRFDTIAPCTTIGGR